MYICGVVIKSISLGASILSSIIFSKPSPNEQIKKIEGISPIKVAQKKLKIFTLNIQGKILEIANGIPPTNL